jgi:hypothetical protein
MWVDDGEVYFVEKGDSGGTNGSLRRFSVANPIALSNIAAGVQSPQNMAFTTTDVFFIEDRVAVSDRLWRTPRAGPPTSKVLITEGIDGMINGSTPRGLHVASGYLYYLNGSALFRVPVAGVTPEQVPGISTNGILFGDDENLYFLQGSGAIVSLPGNTALVPSPVPTAAGQLPAGHTIIRAWVRRGAAIFLASAPTSEGAIVRFIPSTGEASFFVAAVDPVNTELTDSSVASALAVDDTHLYYTTRYSSTSGRVFRVSLLGGTPEILAETNTPLGIAVDDTFMYWAANSSEGVIERRLKE